MVTSSVGIAPLHRILTAPAKWRWGVPAHFCYSRWMAIDGKQRSLCKPHTHSLCSTWLSRGMIVGSAHPADTCISGRQKHNQQDCSWGWAERWAFPLHSLSMPFLHPGSIFVSPAQMSIAKYINAMDRGEKTAGGTTVPRCEIVKAYIETDGWLFLNYI